MRANVLLSNDEAATELGVHPVTVARWRTERRGPPFIKRPNGRIGYPLDDLRSWQALASRYVKPEATVQS
jgi:hypothetical protein